MTTKTTFRKRPILSLLILVLGVIVSGCGANESILRSGKETPTQANAGSEKVPLAKDLEAMQTAGFTYVLVLRRKDGGSIDSEDRGVIKVQTADANRRVSADDGKAFIIGSNVQIPAKNMLVLYDRFAIDNYSPAPVAGNTNSNVNK